MLATRIVIHPVAERHSSPLPLTSIKRTVERFVYGGEDLKLVYNETTIEPGLALSTVLPTWIAISITSSTASGAFYFETQGQQGRGFVDSLISRTASPFKTTFAANASAPDETTMFSAGSTPV